MRRVGKVLIAFFQFLIAVCLLLPVVLTITKATYADFFIVLVEEFWFYPKFWFSLAVAVAIGVGAVVVAVLAAMGLKFGRVKHVKSILFVLLLLMLMPLQTTLLPNYIGLRDLFLLDKLGALILPMLSSPFAIYLMYQYMDSVPYEGFEAARMETGSVFRILGFVILPQTRACIAAVFVFMFAEGFNIVEQPLYFVKKETLKPLSVLAESLTSADSHLIFAVGILCMIPMLLLYGFYEEELTEGLGHLKA
ncbi:MAG: carbohydrate ABC transporter permease [Lachnospiraceae bacterium]|nr:carbohydrate ABC transporter permease [Lachnospiraceae bacterium]